MDFREKYTEAIMKIGAEENAAERALIRAKAEKKRKSGAVMKCGVIAAGLTLIIVCAFNYRSVMSFANSLLGLHYTAETPEGKSAELGVVKPLTDFDYKGFMSSEGAVAEETELADGERVKFCEKQYGSYYEAKRNLALYGIKLPEASYFEELYCEEAETSALYISFNYDENKDIGYGITLQFIRSFYDENGNQLSPSSIQLMSVIETEPKEYLADIKIIQQEGADEYTLYTNQHGISFGINKFIIEEREASHYNIDFVYGNLMYGLSINMKTDNEMTLEELKAKLDTIA